MMQGRRNLTAPPDPLPSGPDRPAIPSERSAWLGLVATLLLCVIASILYFWFTRTQGT